MHKRVYGKRTKRLLLIDSVLFGLADWMKWENGIAAIAMALFISAASLVMGRMDDRRQNDRQMAHEDW